MTNKTVRKLEKLIRLELTKDKKKSREYDKRVQSIICDGLAEVCVDLSKVDKDYEKDFLKKAEVFKKLSKIHKGGKNYDRKNV